MHIKSLNRRVFEVLLFIQEENDTYMLQSLNKAAQHKFGLKKVVFKVCS